MAVQIGDDRVRPGPQGTDLWQGDSLEIQLDRRLVADYDDPSNSDDDYQIGIALETGQSQLGGYRWLPYPLEGALRLPGVARTTESGISVEVAIRWSIF